VQVEEQHVAVGRGQLFEPGGEGFGVAVVGLAVGEVDDDRRVAVGVVGEEAGEQGAGAVEGGAGGRLAIAGRLEPDGEAGVLDGAVGVVLGALLDA